MKSLYQFIPLIFVVLFLTSGTAPAQPAIYLVRHAEKLANWPNDKALDAFQPLSSEGIARAQKLAEQFKPGAVAAIFSSATTRSLHTALPLAQKLKLPIELAEACMDTAAISGFYKKLSQRFGPDKAVVLVSHSNIIPYLLLEAGLPSSCFKEIGIVPASANSWLLIEGYENIWRVEKLHSAQKTCAGFSRIKY